MTSAPAASSTNTAGEGITYAPDTAKLSPTATLPAPVATLTEAQKTSHTARQRRWALKAMNTY